MNLPLFPRASLTRMPPCSCLVNFACCLEKGQKSVFGFEHIRYCLKSPIQGCIYIPLGTNADFSALWTSGVSLSSLLINKLTPKFSVDGINNSPVLPSTRLNAAEVKQANKQKSPNSTVYLGDICHQQCY